MRIVSYLCSIMKILGKASLIALAIVSSSCLSWLESDPVPTKYSAIVTMKPQEDKSFYMKQNDSVAFVALNSELKQYPFKELEEKRAIIYFNVPEEEKEVTVEGFKYGVGVNLLQLDTIRIRNLDLYDKEKESSYGSAFVDLYGNAPGNVLNTDIQDGYLTLACRYMIGGSSKHEISVLYGQNPDDPYELYVRHNANGDYAMGMETYVFAYSLKNLPYTGGEPKDITIKWLSYSSGKEESMKLKYQTRPDWIPDL